MEYCSWLKHIEAFVMEISSASLGVSLTSVEADEPNKGISADEAKRRRTREQDNRTETEGLVELRGRKFKKKKKVGRIEPHHGDAGDGA